MTVVMALEEEVVRIICVYGPQSGRTCAEKERFYDDLGSEWDLHSVGELALGMGDFNGNRLRVMRVCMEEKWNCGEKCGRKDVVRIL